MVHSIILDPSDLQEFRIAWNSPLLSEIRDHEFRRPCHGMWYLVKLITDSLYCMDPMPMLHGHALDVDSTKFKYCHDSYFFPDKYLPAVN